MARQMGAIKYKGTLGEVRHFRIKGLKGHFAGLKGGPTKEQIMTDPAFQRTRENMSEFGGSATAAKAVRVGLAQLMGKMADSRVAGRLTRAMKKINLEDTAGIRGQRSFFISTNRQHLNGFNFNKESNFDSIIYAPYTLTNSVGRDSATLTFAPFNPMNFVNPPSGATHFRIVNAISVISDYEFNTDSGVYEPVEDELNELNKVEYSGYLSLSDDITTPLEIEAELDGSPTLTGDVSVINSIGIEFYQQIGSEYYLFAQGNALKIQTIF